MASPDQSKGEEQYFFARSLVVGEQSSYKRTGSFAHLQTATIRYLNLIPQSYVDI